MTDEPQVYVQATAVCAECGRAVMVQQALICEQPGMLKVRCNHCGKTYEIKDRLAPFLWTHT